MDIDSVKPVGILTERDILRLIELYPEPLLLNVQEVMSRPLVTVDTNTTIEDAARIMTKKQIKRLTVVENDRLVGIITSSDIIRASPTLVNNLIDVLHKIDF